MSLPVLSAVVLWSYTVLGLLRPTSHIQKYTVQSMSEVVLDVGRYHIAVPRRWWEDLTVDQLGPQ